MIVYITQCILLLVELYLHEKLMMFCLVNVKKIRKCKKRKFNLCLQSKIYIFPRQIKKADSIDRRRPLQLLSL